VAKQALYQLSELQGPRVWEMRGTQFPYENRLFPSLGPGTPPPTRKGGKEGLGPVTKSLSALFQDL
jgi:hypothetical protein